MNIWLLEDDPAQAELVQSWLTDADHNVTHFPEGQALIASLANGSFDLLILDWELPDVTGI